jgi:hypothetical protein
MSFLVEQGTFTKATGAATVSQTVTLANGSLTPKLLIMWATPQTAAGFSTPFSFAFGASSGASNSFSAAMASDNNVATSNAGRVMSTKALSILSTGTPTIVAECDLTSFGAGQFVLSWTTNNASAYVIHYAVFGGTDLTNVIVTSKTTVTGTGNKAYTGLGFQPTAMIMFSDGTTATGTATTGIFNIGAAVSSTKRWASCLLATDATSCASSDLNKRTQRTDSCYVRMNASAVVDERYDLVSFDSDGFTINQITHTANMIVGIIAIKGPSVDLGTITKSTAGAPVVDTVSSMSFTPSWVFLNTWGLAASTSVSADATLAFGGMAGASNRGHVWGYQKDITLNTVADNRNVTATAISGSTGPSTINFDGDFSAFSSTGFAVNWTTNNAVAAEICWLALGGANVTSTQTQTATARITATAIKTQPVTARITATTTRTQSSVSRVTASATRTQASTGRITATATSTQPATANIRGTTTRTQPSTARVQITTTRTQPSTARVTATATQTQPATARIRITAVRTQTATARVTASAAKTQPSLARIQIISTRTQPATARIRATATRTQVSVSNIRATTVRTQTSTANISNNTVTSRTITSTANIRATATRTQPATGRIRATTSQAQPATARITATTARTQLSTSRIGAVVTRTQASTAAIAILSTRSQLSTANIRSTTLRTTSSTARIIPPGLPSFVTLDGRFSPGRSVDGSFAAPVTIDAAFAAGQPLVGRFGGARVIDGAFDPVHTLEGII